MRAPSRTHARARALRRSLSLPEAALWSRLRERRPDSPVFRRQHAVGPYVADFYCAAARSVVEVDGWSHADPGRTERDARREAFLAERGYVVVRMAAAEVLAAPDDAAQRLWDTAMSLIDPARGQIRPGG